MKSFAQYTALVSLLAVGVSYFLPWFSWSSKAQVEYSEAFKSSLRGLPPEFLPREQYELRVTIAPVSDALSWSSDKATQEQEPEFLDPMTSFGELLPLFHFGPRGNRMASTAFVVSGLLLVPAFICILRSRRRLALAFTGGALLVAVVALWALPSLSKYLGAAEELQEMTLPGQFRVQYELRYGVTPWFWVGLASLVLATATTAWGVFEQRKQDRITKVTS